MGWSRRRDRAVYQECQCHSTSSSGVPCRMRRIFVLAVCCSIILLQSCKRVSEQTVYEVKNGAFKVVVRTQEMSPSGTQNVDVCVANASSSGFPEKKMQCFLSGYDFDGLSVKWKGTQIIEVSFRSGRVSRFTNSAFAYPGGSVPEEFHTLLCDGCASMWPAKAEGGTVSSLQ